MSQPVSPPSRSDIWTIGQLLEWTTQHFTAKQLDSPRLDAQLLLAEVLGCSKIELYMMYRDEVGPADRARFRALVVQRAQGSPVAYLLGRREFYGLDLEVNRSVLIPRPETEFLVDQALEYARRHNLAHFLDVGTGSGAIAIALCHKWETARGWAVDISPEALAVAERNANKHQVKERLEFLLGDLWEPVPADALFDLIVSNPPYVSTGEYAELSPTVRDHEPRLALEAGPEGLSAIRRLLADAARFLRPGGLLLMEIGSTQGEAVAKLLKNHPEFEGVNILLDYARLPRVAQATRRAD